MWVVLAAVIGFCFIPDQAWAWGPSTHLQFGLQVLDRLSILPGDLQVLLGFYKQQYLYGCISADIIVGKKFIEYRHHCHNWQVGLHLLKKSGSDAIRAFMYGYMSHLAADTVAHNLFVPTKMLESYPNPAMGHLYWELIFDHHLTTQRTLDMYYSLSKNPFTDEDRFLQSSLKPTLFSFVTNKKIFNGLLVLQRLHRWQKLMEGATKRKSVPLDKAEIDAYCELSLNAIVSFLIDGEKSTFCRLDPTGMAALDEAKVLARELKRAKENVLADLGVAVSQIKTQFNSQLQGVKA